MRPFILVFFLLLSFNWAFAQPALIQGKILFATGRPVHGATVTVQGTEIVSFSGPDGFFQLKNVPSGVQTIFVTSLEIRPLSQVVDIKDDFIVLDLIVKPSEEIELQEIVIAGQTSKQEMEKSGFAVHVIDTEEAAIRNLHVNELLDQAVGVRVRQNGGLGAQVEYNLNGMSGRAIGIFIDGVDIATYGSSFNLGNIPPAMIERIEVYKGVLPAHLSGDLLGGAINLVLKKDVSHNSLNASVSYGSFNTWQSDISGTYRGDKSGLTVKGHLFHKYSDNDYEVWGKFARNTLPDGTLEPTRARRFFDAYRTLGGRLELGVTGVDWADRLMFSYNASTAYNEIQHGQYMTIPYMGRFSQSEAQVFGLNFSKGNFLLDGLDLNINGFYSDRGQYLQDTVSWNYNWSGEKMIGFHGLPLKTAGGAQQGAPTMNHIERQILTSRADIAYRFSQNQRLSFNHLFYTIDRQDEDQIRHVLERVYASSSDLRKHVSALAYEGRWLEDKLKSNFFAKYYQQQMEMISPHQQIVDGQAVYAEDIIRDRKSALGYGLALSLDLHPEWTLITSAEKAVRMPAESEVFGGPAENIVANPNLRPEISKNLNLGFRWNAKAWGKHRIFLSASGFLRNTQDKISRKAETRLINEAVEFAPYVNLGLAQSVGFEGELHYTLNRNFTAQLSVSRFNALFKQEFDPETGLRLDSYYNKQLPNEPFFTMNTQVHYAFQNVFQKFSTLNLYYHLGYVDPFKTIWIDSPNHTTPRQIAQDLGASYRFPNHRVIASFDVKNLLNAEIYDNFAVQKPGRAFYFKLNFLINNF